MLKTNDSTDITALYFRYTHVGNTLEGVQFLNLRLLLTAVPMTDGNIHSVGECTTMNASNGNATRIA